MNLEDFESFIYNSGENELECYNEALKNLNLYSLDEKDLEKIISKLRELISNTKIPSLKFNFKFVDYAFFTGFGILLASFIIYKYLFLLPFLLYIVYVLYKEYYNPLINKIVERKNYKLNIREALNNISRVANVLEMRQSAPIDIEYLKVTKEIVKTSDINAIIQDIESKMEYLSEEFLFNYYCRYTNALAKYYSLNVEEGEKELMDLSIELNELLNSNNNVESINNNFSRKRIINNDKKV